MPLLCLFFLLSILSVALSDAGFVHLQQHHEQSTAKTLDKGFKLNLITRPKGSEQTGKLSACTDIPITIEYMVQGALLSLKKRDDFESGWSHSDLFKTRLKIVLY